MKKTKQFLSLILAALMIFTAVPIQGFAFRLKPLEITGVEFETDTPISMRNVENQNVDGISKLFTNFMLDSNKKYYNFYVQFSDGDKVLYSDILSKKDEINKYSEPEVYVKYDECCDALANNKEYVNVYIELLLYTKNNKTIEYSCIIDKKIVPNIIKEINPTTKLSDKVCSDLSYDDRFPDVQFEVEYYDGKKEIIGCGYNLNEVLSGHSVILNKIGVAEFMYYDASYIHTYDLIDPLYTDVKLDNCKFDSSHLKEVTFALTKNDGTIEQHTKALDIGVYEDANLGKIDGYTVDIDFYNSEVEFSSDGKFEVRICIGKNEDIAVLAPEDVCSCKICHYKGLKYIYCTIVSFFWKMFRVNEYCDCGVKHW